LHNTGYYTDCFEIKVRTDTTKFTKMELTGFGHIKYLTIESEMSVEDENRDWEQNGQY